MNPIRLSGFADEISPSLPAQIESLHRFGVGAVELRGVNGRGVDTLSLEEAARIANYLQREHILVSSIGSPIGKIGVTDDFAPHFERYRHVVELAKLFGTKTIRLFSFYLPQDADPAAYRDEVFRRMERLVEYAARQGVTLLHENEKGIYGDNAPRCRELCERFYGEHFAAVFDFANFVQVGQDTLEAYELLAPYIAYVHIKDAKRETGEVVLPGQGDGNVEQILRLLRGDGYGGFLSMEPHLVNFSGLAALEHDPARREREAEEGAAQWKAALDALRAMLSRLDWPERHFRVALAGCGGIAHTHAEALADLPEVTLAAFADPRPERAKAFAEAYHAAAYPSLSALLAAQSPDVVHICAPHNCHVPLAVEAAAAGTRVFLEKPPFLSREEREELASLPVQIGVCFQNRLNASVREAKRLVDSGCAGAFEGARAFVTWKRDERYYTESGWRGQLRTEGGSALINQAIHTLDLMTYFAGPADSAEASLHNHHLRGVIETEDTVEAHLTFGGKPGLFYASTAYCTDAPVLLELCYENVTLRLEGDTLLCRWKDGRVEERAYPLLPIRGKACWGGAHAVCIGAFYESLLGGRPFPIPVESTFATMDALFAIYQSGR